MSQTDGINVIKRSLIARLKLEELDVDRIVDTLEDFIIEIVESYIEYEKNKKKRSLE